MGRRKTTHLAGRAEPRDTRASLTPRKGAQPSWGLAQGRWERRPRGAGGWREPEGPRMATRGTPRALTLFQAPHLPVLFRIQFNSLLRGLPDGPSIPDGQGS